VLNFDSGRVFAFGWDEKSWVAVNGTFEMLD
jgi:hypothetical protein